MRRAVNYFREASQELGRITWPSRQQAVRLTVAVLIFSSLVAFLLGLTDLGLSASLRQIILS